MKDIRKDFTPSLHAFNFGNRFSGLPLPPGFVNLPGLAKVCQDSQIYHGLCGGMCFATYDFFVAGKKIPQLPTVPQPNSPLYQYLYQRQLDTYGANWRYAAKFAQWTVLPNNTVQKLSATELTKVISQLDLGQPVVLGLVYTSIVETLAIWLNHQVLAYDYTTTDCIEIKIYDPNFPSRDDITIAIYKNAPERIACKQKLGSGDQTIKVRGFFVIPYVPVAPPQLQLVEAIASNSPDRH